nr:MAG: capsid protein [Cressdnaviricota sp.]
MQRLPAKLRSKQSFGGRRTYTKDQRMAQIAANRAFVMSVPHTRPLPAMAAANRRVALTEVKSFDCGVVGGALVAYNAVAGAEPGAALAGLTEVNCIPQGATVANRIGNKVMQKSIHFRCSLVAASPTVGEARCMLVYDKQPNGAFPAFGDICLPQPGGAVVVYSPLNIANKSRFQVIRDQFFNFDVAQSLIHHVDWYCKGRWETEFGANAGNIGDFRTGAILFICMTTYATGAIQLVPNASSRVRYFD